MKIETERLGHCPVCRGGNLHHLLDAPDYESQSGTYGIEECLACGVAFTNPRPREEELPKLYANRSTADFPRMGGFARRLRDYAIDRYLADQFGRAQAGAGVFAALDYGCGDGALARGLLRLSAARNFSVQITAVDFHDSAPPALAGTGSNVVYRTNSEWHAGHGRYDAIFLRHVLEHHSNPLRLLRDFAAALQPNGRLFVEVPNRNSVWARILGHYYSGYYLPRHLFHFDRASLGDTLRDAGFQDVAVGLAHTPLIGHSLAYLTGFEIGNTGLLGLGTFPLQVGLDALCGTSTTLRAIAVSHG